MKRVHIIFILIKPFEWRLCPVWRHLNLLLVQAWIQIFPLICHLSVDAQTWTNWKEHRRRRFRLFLPHWRGQLMMTLSNIEATCWTVTMAAPKCQQKKLKCNSTTHFTAPHPYCTRVLRGRRKTLYLWLYGYLGLCSLSNFWNSFVGSSGIWNVSFHYEQQPGKIQCQKKTVRRAKKKGERNPWGVAHQKLRICFQFPTMISENNQSNCTRGQNWQVTRPFPLTSPHSAVLKNNIFFYRKKTCLINPFIRDDARLRSASLPAFLTAVTICPSLPPCAVWRGTGRA